MDQIFFVTVIAAALYRWHMLAPQSISMRVLKFVEEFGKSAAGQTAANGKEVFYVRIRK